MGIWWETESWTETVQSDNYNQDDIVRAIGAVAEAAFNTALYALQMQCDMAENVLNNAGSLTAGEIDTYRQAGEEQKQLVKRVLRRR